MATIYGNSGSNNLTGTSANDFIYGYGGNDTLTGLAGNDLLDGGTGIDTMIGGAGDDTYLVDSYSDVITELAGGGVDTIKTSLSYTLLENYVNNLTLTGSSNLNGTGNSYNNVITGNSGNNILEGKAGIDTLIGGAGDDTYLVDSTTDVITELAGQGVDTVVSSVSYTLRENYLNNLTLTGSANLNGTGNTYDNVITGNDGDNLLTGGDGNDTLTARKGSDILYGENGNDVLNGSVDPESFSYFLYTEMYGGEGNDSITGFGDMYGGTGNDSLRGYGNLYGGDGNDVLTINEYSAAYGGLGNDTIYDNDIAWNYVGFDTLNEGIDTIISDNISTPEIGISASGFGGGLSPFNITDAQFAYGSSATTSTQRLLYDTTTGYLRFDVDGNGSAPATVFAIFQGAPTLTRNDFEVF